MNSLIVFSLITLCVNNALCFTFSIFCKRILISFWPFHFNSINAARLCLKLMVWLKVLKWITNFYFNEAMRNWKLLMKLFYYCIFCEFYSLQFLANRLIAVHFVSTFFLWVPSDFVAIFEFWNIYWATHWILVAL